MQILCGATRLTTFYELPFSVFVTVRVTPFPPRITLAGYFGRKHIGVIITRSWAWLRKRYFEASSRLGDRTVNPFNIIKRLSRCVHVAYSVISGFHVIFLVLYNRSLCVRVWRGDSCVVITRRRISQTRISCRSLQAPYRGKRTRHVTLSPVRRENPLPVQRSKLS